MKKILFFLVIVLLASSAFSQTNKRPQQKKTSTSSTSSQNKKTTQTKSQQGTKKVVEKPKIVETPLPYNSNDCLFAIEINPDTTFGPTTPPNGGGRVMEIMSAPHYSNLFEYEHNTVWYKLSTPYTGRLIFTITPTDPTNDYDFLLYKYTDQYFCNRVATKKVQPILSNLSRVDSAKRGVIGASEKGTKVNIPKSSSEGFTAAVPAVKGDVFYLVLDNLTPSGKGHSVKYSIHVDFIKPKIRFVDKKDRKPIPVDFLVIEKNSENRILYNNKNYRGGEIRFVPGFDYAMYVKKDGYFAHYEDFNSMKYIEDTVINIPMVRIEKGSVFDVPNIYFDEGFSKLLSVSDSSLSNFVQMFKNHPEINFEVKGYIQSYGFDVEKDMKISLDRAVSVMQFFVQNGIEPDRMTAKGMTRKEIQVLSTEILNRTKSFTDKRIEIIIKSIDPAKKIN